MLKKKKLATKSRHARAKQLSIVERNAAYIEKTRPGGSLGRGVHPHDEDGFLLRYNLLPGA